MKPCTNKYLLLRSFWLAGSLLSVTTAQADLVSYNSTSTLTYTINSITSPTSTNPNNLSILATFHPLYDANSYYDYTNGNATNIANNPGTSTLPIVGNSVSNIFSVSRSALNGTIDTLNTGLFNLSFNNTSTNNYTIDLSLAYLLNSISNGLYANSSIALDYGYILTAGSGTGDGYAGYDSVNAVTIDGHANDNQTINGSAELVFSLAPGASGVFSAQEVITGDLQAVTPTPVPIPNLTLFLTMLGIIGVQIKIKRLQLNCNLT